MEKKSKTKVFLILVSLFVIVLLVFGLSGCQVLSRFTGGTKTAGSAADAVETYTVNRGDLLQSLSTTGTVDSAETKKLTVKVAGEVLETVDVGSQVKKGDTLLKVDNSDLIVSIKQSQINLEVAEISLKQLQISYKAALDANHIAVQVAQLDNISAQQSIDASVDAIENTDRIGNASIESAQLALQKAQDSFNFSIAQAQVALNKAADQLNSTSGSVATDYNYQSAYLSKDSAIASATNALDAATAALYETDAKAQDNNDTARNSYEQALISQSKTYWNTISSLEQAKQKIQSTIESINSSNKQLELAKISLETASEDVNNSSVLAPFDGIVLASTYGKGENAPINSMAVTIASIDFIVKSSINETEISKSAVGNRVSLTFDAYPDQEFEGEIASISLAPTISSNLTSYAVTVRLKNTEKLKLFYGLTTNLTIITAEAKNALMVPVQAVYTENGKQYVDVIESFTASDSQTGSSVTDKTMPDGTRPDGTMPDGTRPQRTQATKDTISTGGSAASSTKKIEITTGINNYTYYEVLSGLKEGDMVLTSSS